MTEVSPDIGLVTEALIQQPLTEVMDWLVRDVPEITGLEIGTGAYAPTNHCDMSAPAVGRGSASRHFIARSEHAVCTSLH